jgi:hypothetical protein
MADLYTNKDNTIHIDIDGGDTLPSAFLSARYALFTLAGTAPVFEASTPSGITTEGNQYVIKIAKNTLPEAGTYYEEVEAVDANNSELLIHSGTRKITTTRL